MKLYESNKTIVDKRKIDGFTDEVIIKFLKTENPTEQQLNRFYHEYDITNLLKSKYIRKAIKKTIIDGKPAVVLEYFDGTNFSEIKELDSVDKFILLACKIVEALGKIHELNIIHKDINPQNILVNKEGEIKIIDFEISSKYSLKTQNLGNPEALEGTLNYISPEQTGRMNRTLDYRSDFYSLGVTFYEILTRQLPFEHSDPLQLIHAHIATVPVAPSKINDKIPQILSNIVLKLLSKNAEDRYQSAFGLKHDLQQLSKSSKLLESSIFKLGEKDFSGKLIIPEKLYGREKETKQLLDIYKKISSANKELLLVAGFSGTGKSMLVHEIHKKITENNGIYIEGKFDQFQKDIPYHALTIAFTNFVDIILHQTDENLLYWKNLITKAVGNIGKILTDLIPDFELLIGKQADLPKLEGEQAQNRFNYLWQSFMQAICNKKHPLVLFIDDLQWTDFNSLKLIKTLFLDPDIENFMCITAYRNNEVDSTHIFMQLIEELKKQETTISKIEVENLNKNDILNLLTDTLSGTKQAEIQKLVELIFSKTQGNAFFTNQFIKTLYEEKLLTYSFEKAVWQWEISEIENLKITENVVELLGKKIKKLPKTTQQLLQTASCIGNKFSLAMLQTVADKKNPLFESKTFNYNAGMEAAIFAGLLIPLKNNKYKFVHNSIQQAIYQKILDTHKNNFHLQIGRLLIKKHVTNEKILTNDNIQNEDLGKIIFDIVNQINFGLHLIYSKEEKQQFIKLNIIAGKKAKSTAAYTVALTYFETAKKLLDKNSWNTDYKLTLEINENIAKLCYLIGEYKKTDDIVNIVIDNTTNFMDNIEIYDIQINSYRIQNKLEEAVALGLKVLKQLGVKYPKKQTKIHIAISYIKLKIVMGRKDFDDLSNIPKMVDKKQLAVMKISTAMVSSAYFTNPNLMSLMSLLGIRISIKYGITEYLPFIYAGFSIALSGMNKIDNAMEFSKLAIDMINKLNANKEEAKVNFMYNYFVSIWKNNIAQIVTNIYGNFKLANELGDIEYASYSLYTYFFYFYTDIPLTQIKNQLLKNHIFLEKVNNKRSIKFNLFRVQYCTKLIGNKSLKESNFNEDIELKNAIKNSNNYFLSIIFEQKVYFNLIFNNFEDAKINTSKLEEYYIALKPTYTYATSILYLSLALSELYILSGTKIYLKKIKKQIKQMKLWAKHCPANYQHKYYLMQAELMRATGKTEQAKEYFDKAIFGAKQENMYCDEALAWQLAARFYIKINKTHLAEYYMQNAHNVYKKWGAFAVCNHIEQQHPTLIYTNNYKTNEIKTNEIKTNETVVIGNNTTVFDTGKSLDMSSVIKASQSLSGEVQLEKLLQNMMQIIIENAGADSGFIITNDNEKYNIEAEYNHKNKIMSVLQNENIENSKKLSANIIKYVIRTRKVLVLDNATNNSTYENDEYIKNNKVKSVLCQPIIHKNKLVAILYLENNINVGVFTEQRLDTINILSSQIAISIENAILYENLEQKVQERTQEVIEKNEKLNQQNEKIQATADSLQKANDEITNKNEQITASVRYAKTIQTATLPFEERIKKQLDLFILFRPKDIVSGDFYWFTHLPAKDEFSEKKFIAAVDCTGHGVPGAFMSMIGMQLLNKIVNQDKTISPADILLQLHNGIYESLKQATSSNTDGMDVCLCCIESENTQQFKITFSGAKRPLYYFEKEKNKLTRIKGDRKTIGGKIRINSLTHFSNKEIVLQKNDLLYLTTDGYVDQNNKERQKIGSPKLKEILNNIANKPLSEQKQILETELDNWQAEEKQRDDITVVGIKL